MGADRWPITTARHNTYTRRRPKFLLPIRRNTKELNETDAKGKWAREKETKGQQRSKKQLSDSALNKFCKCLV